MAKGFKHGGGGGGAGLNFKIVGNPQPAEAKENTIWVDTDDITGWEFSPTEPENPVPGMVWVSTGTSSPVAFNTLKKNGIMVYPMSAKQYIAGAWVDVTAMSYQGGWVEWIPAGALYWRGNECEALTGGWTSKAWKAFSDSGSTAQTFTLAKNADNLEFTKTGLIGAVMHTANKVDLTNVKAIHFKGRMECGSIARWAAFYVWSDLSGSVWDTKAAAKQTGTANTVTTEFTLDVSTLDGEYYLGFGIYHDTSKVIVEELYMEGI